MNVMSVEEAMLQLRMSVEREYIQRLNQLAESSALTPIRKRRRRSSTHPMIRKTRRRMSAATRKKMAISARKRWASRRKKS